MPRNLVRTNIRFVIARNQWGADRQVILVKQGLAKAEKVLHLTRDAALIARNRMRSIHHAAYSVYPVEYIRE